MSTGIAASQLAKMEKDELYAHLGSIQKESKISLFKTLALPGEAAAVTAQTDVDAGKSSFRRLNKQAYDYFCGGCGNDPGAQNCLDHLKAALGISTDTATMITALSTLLTATFGWGAIIAGIVAAVLIKFVFPTALTDLCAAWKTKL